MTAPLPVPVPSRLDRPHWDGARDQRLMIQRCEQCGRHQHPAVQSCPVCDGDMAWVRAEGTGRVHTFTVFHRAYHPAFPDRLPYNVSIIELDEGPLMLSTVVDADEDELEIDLPVRVDFERVDDEITRPVFRR